MTQSKIRSALHRAIDRTSKAYAGNDMRAQLSRVFNFLNPAPSAAMSLYAGAQIDACNAYEAYRKAGGDMDDSDIFVGLASTGGFLRRKKTNV